MSHSSPFSTNSVSLQKDHLNHTNKQAKIVEKIITDLEELCKKLLNIQQNDENNIRDDCLELQKFCAKLEYLIQYNLKEKKGLTSTSTALSNSSSQNDSNSNREYWTFILDSLKSSRSFEDAIKYVKNINEIHTNLGRARAFIRFCLQYHRLADAIQQLFMEDKIVNNWYKDSSVWLNENNKYRIIQLLYDLNDVNFELIAKNNFELDTTWPTIQLNMNKNVSRNRTFSISSYTSYATEKEKDHADTQSVLLSSTPLEMDDDLLYSNINTSNTQKQSHTILNSDSMAQSIYYDTSNSNMINQIEQYEKKIEDLTSQLSLKENQLLEVIQNDRNASDSSDLIEQIRLLNQQLNEKNKQYNDLNSCLIKQSNLCENLSELLKKSEDKNKELNSIIDRNLITISNLENQYNSLKLEVSSKTTIEDELKKEVLSQTEAINNLKETTLQQDKLIKELKLELNLAIRERTNEVDAQANEAQRNKITIQLKDEEIYLLNDQIQKLSRALDTEREQNTYLTNELDELKSFYKNLNDKNTNLIQQLEADNNEIKKRLVKLIKEKAELWQKADNLEYENLLKANSMWVDDANVTNCMSCNSAFGLLLRKHHCRICLKIYCYYCCNDWIEYNNSKLRVCKKCHDTRENVNKVKSILNDENSIKSHQDISEHVDDIDQDVSDDDDPDINFEVRAEKLNSAEHSGDDIYANIYDSMKPKSSSSDDNTNVLVDRTEKINSQNDKKSPSKDELKVDMSGEETDNESDTETQANKFLNKLTKFEFKYLNLGKDVVENEEAGLVVRKKKLKKKIKSSSSLVVNKKNSQDDFDTFAIVSQEDIDKIK